MLGNWFAWFEEAIVLRALSVLTFLLPSAALNFLKVFQMMWRAGTTLVFMLLDLLSAPLMLMQTLFRAISAIVRPVFMCCSKLSSLRSAASVAAPAAQAASQGQSFMSILWREVFPFLKFLWTLFRNIILNGITKIGMWVLQHWTSFHRFVIVRHFRVIVFTGSILIVDGAGVVVGRLTTILAPFLFFFFNNENQGVLECPRVVCSKTDETNFVLNSALFRLSLPPFRLHPWY